MLRYFPNQFPSFCPPHAFLKPKHIALYTPLMIFSSTNPLRCPKSQVDFQHPQLLAAAFQSIMQNSICCSSWFHPLWFLCQNKGTRCLHATPEFYRLQSPAPGRHRALPTHPSTHIVILMPKQKSSQGTSSCKHGDNAFHIPQPLP